MSRLCIDIDVSEFGKKFDPSKLDFNNPEKKTLEKLLQKF